MYLKRKIMAVAMLAFALLLFDRAVVAEEKPEIFVQMGGHSGYVNSVAFSPDGKYIISGSSDKTIILWDVASGNQIRSFAGHRSAITSIAFSPDGRYVFSGSDDNTMKIWDVKC